MKITKSRLKQIITEELQNILAERDGDTPKDVATRLNNFPATARAGAVNDFFSMMNGSSDQIKNYPHVTNHREFAMQVLKLLGEIPDSYQLPDDPFAPGSTQYMKPGERSAARRARAAAKTAKVDIRPRVAARRARGEIRQRAEKLLDVLYPDASNRELVFTIRQEDDEGTLVDSLFGFMFPRETTMDKPNPFLMDRVEEWIKTRSGDEEIALEVGGRSKPENLDSLLTYIETKGMELGKAEFDKAKAHAARRPARNVPVGRAATPGTPERAALDRLMSVEVPPKRRR